jgi:hypothetical protein
MNFRRFYHRSQIMTEPRYIATPHQHGYQVYDTTQGEFCIATWTTVEAMAQRWADMLNQCHAAFMADSRPVVALINKGV